ncbi:MAG: hypothetical protein U0T83_02535 [Bacteriovoracaceae bacterium]
MVSIFLVNAYADKKIEVEATTDRKVANYVDIPYSKTTKVENVYIGGKSMVKVLDTNPRVVCYVIQDSISCTKY